MTGKTSRKFKRRVCSPFSAFRFFSIITTNEATYIQNVSNVFFLFFLIYTYHCIFTGFLFRNTKRTNRKWRYMKLYTATRTCSQKEQEERKECFWTVCVWRKTWVWALIWKKGWHRPKQTEKVRLCKVCSQFPCLHKPPDLHWQKASSKMTLLLLFVWKSFVFESFSCSVRSFSHWKSTKIKKKMLYFRTEISNNAAANLLWCEYP